MITKTTHDVSEEAITDTEELRGNFPKPDVSSHFRDEFGIDVVSHMLANNKKECWAAFLPYSSEVFIWWGNPLPS